MSCTPLESGRSVLQTAECALLSLFAHGTVVWLAVGLTAGGLELPEDAREARVFFLLPPDKMEAEPYQMEVFRLGRLGVDLQDGMDLTRPGPGPRVRPQAWNARGPEKGSGAQGALPFGPVDKLALDSVFSVLEVDHTVERYEWSAAPAYPEELMALGTEGVVRTLYIVDTDGRVDSTSIRVLYSDDPRFTASVIAALGETRFRPAKRRGKTVRQEVAQQFRFKRRPSTRVPGSISS